MGNTQSQVLEQVKAMSGPIAEAVRQIREKAGNVPIRIRIRWTRKAGLPQPQQEGTPELQTVPQNGQEGLPTPEGSVPSVRPTAQPSKLEKVMNNLDELMTKEPENVTEKSVPSSDPVTEPQVPEPKVEKPTTEPRVQKEPMKLGEVPILDPREVLKEMPNFNAQQQVQMPESLKQLMREGATRQLEALKEASREVQASKEASAETPKVAKIPADSATPEGPKFVKDSIEESREPTYGPGHPARTADLDYGTVRHAETNEIDFKNQSSEQAVGPSRTTYRSEHRMTQVEMRKYHIDRTFYVDETFLIMMVLVPLFFTAYFLGRIFRQVGIPSWMSCSRSRKVIVVSMPVSGQTSPRYSASPRRESILPIYAPEDVDEETK